ncbi:MarR family winged helix-turn-helix transcriptional regulator [Clostridium manihotivorum]|uniref:MarR family transcriptional regulator n=1 Tax=Clostridium manihotivorum TaxID=2320868 RepID=A0A3R5V4T8_9CLOT|nr:MarR family transcriptional regulator [Clostridium manihotivorum]QAA30212.1 MarR family transcriptional regulator [Clostridium manihotivorum]
MEEANSGIIIIRKLKDIGKLMKKNNGNNFEAMNLTHSQGMLVGVLCHSGEMKVSDLSEKLGLSNSTVSGIIDRLEKQGLVERKRSKEDKRVVYVGVTEVFMNNFRENFNQIEKRFEQMVSSATEDEIETILKGLETLIKIMNCDPK